VTRDAALMLLNRSPEGLDYWMESDPRTRRSGGHGTLKAELVRIVEEQRGSDVTQAFVIKQIKVDPAALTSEVKGTLKTFVGAHRHRQRRAAVSLHLDLPGPAPRASRV
jgi:conjugal transfer pilus assembly protein TraE